MDAQYRHSRLDFDASWLHLRLVEPREAGEGLLEFRRGRGISVVGIPERGQVIKQAHDLVHYARKHGFRVDELIENIQTVD